LTNSTGTTPKPGYTHLTAADVRQALAARAAGYSTAAVTMGHLALKRAIRYAEANDLISRNVAALADTPQGQQGRPSKSLTLDQAIAVTAAARTTEIVYRRELRPVITTGAEIMDQLFTAT
jgi:site-specific recombinase XerD